MSKFHCFQPLTKVENDLLSSNNNSPNVSLFKDPSSVVSTTTKPGLPKKRRRPPYSYTALIAQAILLSENKQLTLREVYDSINQMYPQICQGPDIGWQNTIRHNLSLNQCFERIPRHKLPPSLSSKLHGKGSYWTVDVELMDTNTRKRLEEALATGKTAAISHPASATESPVARKRMKFPSKPPLSRSSSPSENNSSSIDKPAVYGPAMRPYYLPPIKQHHQPYYNENGIQYVSTDAQSPSPYFQSSLNSPIAMPALSATPKHILTPQQQQPVLPSISSTLMTLPSLVPVANDSRVFNQRNSSVYRNLSGRINSIKPSNTSYANVLQRSQYLYGGSVSCARSTAKSSGCNSTINSSPSASWSMGSGRECTPSPSSLSPVSSEQPLASDVLLPYNNKGGSTSTNGDKTEPEKLSIDHLLN